MNYVLSKEVQHTHPLAMLHSLFSFVSLICLFFLLKHLFAIILNQMWRVDTNVDPFIIIMQLIECGCILEMSCLIFFSFTTLWNVTKTFGNGYASERIERDPNFLRRINALILLIQYAPHSMWWMNELFWVLVRQQDKSNRSTEIISNEKKTFRAKIRSLFWLFLLVQRDIGSSAVVCFVV